MASVATATPHSAAASSENGGLALTFQEPLTVAVRLRANRQVAPDAGSFRRHIMQLLATADRNARAAGYGAQDVKLGVYAVVALIDETVLDATQPMFADWSRQSLQEQVFGGHLAGENFFRNLSELMTRQDSAQLADLLEIYELCLLLGFRGRYGADATSLRTITASVGERIRRIRGGEAPLSPAWQIPANEAVAPPNDPWIPRLIRIAAVAVALAIVLYILFRFNLGARADDVIGAAAEALSR